MEHIEQQAQLLIEEYKVFIFPEFYSHTDCMMWKILNPYTDFKEDKLVLCEVFRPDGMQAAIQIALTTLALKKEKWMNKMDFNSQFKTHQ